MEHLCYILDLSKSFHTYSVKMSSTIGICLVNLLFEGVHENHCSLEHSHYIRCLLYISLAPKSRLPKNLTRSSLSFAFHIAVIQKPQRILWMVRSNPYIGVMC